MANVISSTGADPFSAMSVDQSAQKQQFAKYAIMRAAQYMKDGRMDDAIGSFKQALAFDPNNVSAITNMGNIYLSQNKNADAIKAFQDLVRVQGDSAAYVKLGNAYIQDQQYTESEKAFKKASQLNPKDPLADYTLGMQYVQTDRQDEAEQQFLKVKQIVPGDGNVYWALGSLYNKEGRYDEAVTNLKTALNLRKDFDAANFELGSAYSNLGMKDEANAQLKILQDKGSAYASGLSYEINKPQILAVDVSTGGFNLSLGARAPLPFLDISLLKPNAMKEFSVNIAFNVPMDVASVTDPQNWSITRASGGAGGYYNSGVYPKPREVVISPVPMSVNYNPNTMEATVRFRIAQNANGNATIDPKHLVFKFSGTDENGRSMDVSADEIDGYSGTGF